MVLSIINYLDTLYIPLKGLSLVDDIERSVRDLCGKHAHRCDTSAKLNFQSFDQFIKDG